MKIKINKKKACAAALGVSLLAAAIVQALQIPPLNRTNLSKTT